MHPLLGAICGLRLAAMIPKLHEREPDDVALLVLILKFRKAYADRESASTEESRAEINLLIDRMHQEWTAKYGRDDLYEMAFG
jgi:hypothetical protein